MSHDSYKSGTWTYTWRKWAKNHPTLHVRPLFHPSRCQPGSPSLPTCMRNPRSKVSLAHCQTCKLCSLERRHFLDTLHLSGTFRLSCRNHVKLWQGFNIGFNIRKIPSFHQIPSVVDANAYQIISIWRNRARNQGAFRYIECMLWYVAGLWKVPPHRSGIVNAHHLPSSRVPAVMSITWTGQWEVAIPTKLVLRLLQWAAQYWKTFKGKKRHGISDW